MKRLLLSACLFAPIAAHCDCATQPHTDVLVTTTGDVWDGLVTQTGPYTFDLFQCVHSDRIFTDSLEAGTAGPWVFTEIGVPWLDLINLDGCILRTSPGLMAFQCPAGKSI